ncbi:MAG: glycosyltransferase family 4 protein [Proteobacteria bacterium]|nr:glycosyltransferase family 4 protein [Pseudomonadota bacterium]
MNSKVLHILSGDLWGGKEAQVYSQMMCSKIISNQCEVLFLNDGEVSDKFQHSGLKCIIIDEKEGIYNILRRIISYCKESKIKILVAHGYKEIIIAFLCWLYLRIPFITYYHGAAEQNVGYVHYKMRFYEKVVNFISRYSAKRVVFVSKELATRLSFSGISKTRINYNCISQLTIKPSNEVAFKNNAVMMIGRLVPVKRFDLALQAISILIKDNIDVSLYIYGDGPLHDELCEIAAKMKVSDNVHFMGFNFEAIRYLAQADIFLITSDSEGLPTVLLEALNMNRPIVATRVGGIVETLELFHQSNYKLVSSDNHEEIAEALREILLSSKQINFSANNEIIKTTFSAEVSAKRMNDIYNEVLSEYNV